MIISLGYHRKSGTHLAVLGPLPAFYLEDRMPGAAVESLERVVNDVLGRLEDPDRPECGIRRGLLMGHVQSGKTANFCGLICKAADAGYKVVIVLSGIHNSLRSQTQIRLDEGFLGFMSEPEWPTDIKHSNGQVSA